MDLADLTRDLEALRDEALAAVAAAPDVAALEALELDVLGKKGRLTGVLRGIGALPAEDRPRVGAIANAVRVAIEARARGARHATARLGAGRPARAPRRSTSRRPGRPIRRGTLHPINETIDAIAEVFGQFGFVVYEGPEIEDDLTQLPDAQHPARPPGARPVGHALRRRRGPPAADPHVARPDPGDARRRRRRSGPCCRAAATATRRSTPATPRSSSRSRA